METDFGLLRPILFGGSMMFLVVIIPYAVMFIYSASSKVFSIGQKLSITMMVIVLLILQIKGGIYITGTMPNVLILLYFSYYFFSKNREKMSKQFVNIS